MQLRTARDAELPEYLAQVVIHGAGADEEPGGDRMVRGALGGQPGDPRLLRRERIRRPGSASSGVLADEPQLGKLTSREWAVLTRLLDGQRVSAIAADLYVSQSTVRNHLSSIYAKLGVHSQVDLIRLIRRGTKRSAAE